MIKAVIYDFDGTLVNSLSVVVAATNVVLGEHGAASRPAPEIIAGMVDPTGQRLGGLLGIADAKRQACLAEAFYAAAHVVACEHAIAYVGIPAALSGVAAKGLRQGVVSNNQGRLIRRIIDHLGLAGHFTVAFGEEDVPALKPDPRGLRLVAERLGVMAGECVYVGDTLGDLHTAKAAGMPCIGVSWGITSRTELERHAFTAIIDAPDDLMTAIRAGCLD